MIYRIFSSIKTSVWLLSAMTVLYVLGTVFPQGAELDDYIKQGGRFVTAVRLFDLLNIFKSPLFILLTLLLSLNLLICIFDRYRRMRKRAELIPVQAMLKAGNTFKLDGEISVEEVEDRLLRSGFKLIDSSETVRVFGKGVSYWWLSWAYHIGMVLAITGCFVTFFTAFEDEVTLWPEKQERISLYSPDTRINRLKKRLGMRVKDKDPSKEFIIKLKEFRTDYYQMLNIDYPKEALSRISIALGYERIGLKKEKKLYPKHYVTSFTIRTPEGKEIEAETRVNKPFRTKGLTLYQMGFDQRVTLVVNGKKREVEIYKPFELNPLEGRYLLKSVEHGRVYRKDGSSDEQPPRVGLFRIKKQGKPEEVKLLYKDRPEDISGVTIVFKDFKEASLLSYRVDPGVWIIGLAALFVFIGLSVRVYGWWYRVRVFQSHSRVYVNISTRGLLANKEKLLFRLGFAKERG